MQPETMTPEAKIKYPYMVQVNEERPIHFTSKPAASLFANLMTGYPDKVTRSVLNVETMEYMEVSHFNL